MSNEGATNEEGSSGEAPQPIVPCQVDELAPLGANARVGLFYLHGGGLVYGRSDDLPLPYVEMIRDAGLTLSCVSYPLAPETQLPQMLDVLEETLRWYVTDEMPRLGLERYLLFGRSAGAYLAFLLARHVHAASLLAPAGVIDFYGFRDITSDFLSMPSEHYLSIPAIPHTLVEKITGSGPVTMGQIERRFPLYVYARQTGSLAEMVGAPGRADDAPAGQPDRFRITSEDVGRLPPLFIAASTADQDVPYAESKSLSRTARPAMMHTVYGLEHDFDRDVLRPEGRQAYERCLSWVADTLRDGGTRA